MTIEELAILTHESNRIYCNIHDDHSQKSWIDADPWQREAAIAGVRAHLANPELPPDRSHHRWMMDKVSQGWKRGSVKDGDLKTHPDMVPYEDLSSVAQGKDYLFAAIVNGLRKFVQE